MDFLDNCVVHFCKITKKHFLYVGLCMKFYKTRPLCLIKKRDMWCSTNQGQSARGTWEWSTRTWELRGKSIPSGGTRFCKKIIYTSSSEPTRVLSGLGRNRTPAGKPDFYTVGFTPPGELSKRWMFFLQSVRSWLVPTWYDSGCQRTKWLPWLVRIRIGISWCNAGRGTGPSWLMATRSERDPRSRVCSACGWDGVLFFFLFLLSLETIVG